MGCGRAKKHQQQQYTAYTCKLHKEIKYTENTKKSTSTTFIDENQETALFIHSQEVILNKMFNLIFNIFSSNQNFLGSSLTKTEHILLTYLTTILPNVPGATSLHSLSTTFTI